MTTIIDLIEKYQDERVGTDGGFRDALDMVISDLQDLVREPAPVTSPLIGIFTATLWHDLVRSGQQAGMPDDSVRRMRAEWLTHWRPRAAMLLNVVEQERARHGRAWVARQKQDRAGAQGRPHQHEEPK